MISSQTRHAFLRAKSRAMPGCALDRPAGLVSAGTARTKKQEPIRVPVRIFTCYIGIFSATTATPSTRLAISRVPSITI